MAVTVNLGIFRNQMLAHSSNISFGNTIAQNRNQTKENRGAVGIGDGVHFQPIARLHNLDADAVDAFSMDGPNFMDVQQF